MAFALCLAVPSVAAALRAAGAPPLSVAAECAAGFEGATPELRCDAAVSFVNSSFALPSAKQGVSFVQQVSAVARRPPSEDKKWDELCEKEKDAARKLGYGKQKWDTDGWVDSEGKKWDQLDSAEKEGAQALGWTQASWDDDYECRALESHIRKLEDMEKRCLTGTPRETRETCWGQMKAVLPKYLEAARKKKEELKC